jgi:hypothetical protein
MRDLPASRDLLALAREALLDELAPLLPPERRRDAHLIATVIAIALREGAGEGGREQIERELAEFYAEAAPHPDSLAACGERRDVLRRFAADLRNGAFETSPSQQKAARAILWQLTIDKLREGNPQFLVANGFKAGGRSM